MFLIKAVLLWRRFDVNSLDKPRPHQTEVFDDGVDVGDELDAFTGVGVQLVAVDELSLSTKHSIKANI